MRRIVVISHISLDGVLQAMGRPDEDPSGGFAYGGWISDYSDEVVGAVIQQEMNMPFDLLIGRKTFEIWAPYWPNHADIWKGVNTATKYVASNTVTSHTWQPTVFLGGDIAQKISEIKQKAGPDLHVYGSGNLIQTLMAYDLVDAFWLKIYPLTLGKGKRLFDGGSIPMGFKLTEGKVSPTGVIIANYERTGALTATGS
ncbi:dihydrofolate reductase family protein [Phototrophicus methaneseepsis]|uniref:Dihydrofolate reductase family protein n=1 Tax=Phototrophicus methaneseepsis TaxID=2710758 RepID=A0A7S8ICS3_9CHLR|nr:dihydrofolate reductase family protein [Phototrophicus methaneseepsis]QPC80832.1 dihydrofolate reductase family protein [Phototrophicus methaneseepsis]